MDKRAKILVVDDEPFNVEYLKQELEEDGYDILSAENGRAALALVSTEPPDVILLDILMPTMNGYQVCRELRENPATRSIPIVMLTARSQESDKFWGKEAGADAYLVKPFDMNELMEAVVEQIGGLLSR